MCLLFLPLRFCFLGGAFRWGMTSSGEKISSVTTFVNGCCDDFQGWIGYAGTHVPMFVHKLGLIKPRQT